MASKKRAKVLIVEDDLLLSMVAERHIKSLGFELVGKATSGKEAIEKEASLNPDVILMDISLQGTMTGIEAMKEIRKSSDVPVIYLSGSSEDDRAEEASATNYSGYLTKPVTRDDLEAPLVNAINSDGMDSGTVTSFSNQEE